MNKIKNYKGIKYIVFWLEEQEHYNCYVKLPKDYEIKTPEKELFDAVYQWGRLGIVTNEKCKAYKDFVEKVRENYSHYLEINYYQIPVCCHGGLTFGEIITKENKDDFLQPFSIGSWIGWDYCHCGDKSALEKSGKDWYYEEVKEECKRVIEQLIKK